LWGNPSSLALHLKQTPRLKALISPNTSPQMLYCGETPRPSHCTSSKHLLPPQNLDHPKPN
jgi:hypothetical protein